MDPALAFTPRQKEVALFEVLEAHRTAVFGGYIRDVLSGADPHDVDVVVRRKRLPALRKALTELGYWRTSEDIIDTNHETWRKDSALDIDLIVDDEAGGTILGPCAAPDADINTLSWTRVNGTYRLCCWCDDWPAGELAEKLRSGSKDVCAYSSASEERLRKLQSAGYIIVKISEANW